MLRAVCQGAGEQLPQIYRQCPNFVVQYQLQLTGLPMKGKINELAISSMDEYLTVIEITVIPTSSE